MSITVTHTERSLDGPSSFVWRYLVKGSLVIDDIATALYNDVNCPPNYGFWLRQWDNKKLRDVGGGVWECEVPYGVGDIPLVNIPSLPGGSSGGTTGGGAGAGSAPAPADGDPLGREWSCDFSLGSRLRTKSIESLGGYFLTLDGAPPVLKPFAIPGKKRGAVIGYNPETGDVSGVEVPTAVIRLEFQVKLPVLTMGYIKKIRRYVGKINSEAFLSFPAGEVKLAGGVLNWSNANGFTVRYTCDVAQNQYGIGVGDKLPTVNVKGWEYLDVTFETQLNPTGKPGSLIKEATEYVVHRVIEEVDLNDLFT